MSLPSFTITGTLLDLLGNTALGHIVGNGLGGAMPATVTFTSNVPVSDFVTFGGVAYRVDEVTATVGSDGSITRNGDPVKLLANDGGLSVDGVQWQAHVAGMKRFWFNAPTDGGTIDLASVAPVPGVSLVGLTTLDWNSITGKPAAIAVTPEQFGAVGNGSTNDAVALNACFAAAAGKTVLLDPSKTYAHNALLTIGQAGTVVTGGGTLKATNKGALASGVDISGDNVTLEHVTLTCPGAVTRRDQPHDMKLVLTGDGAVVRNVTIDGSAAGGLMAFGATNFLVESCLVTNTLADGYHATHGASDGRFVNCAAKDIGDDGFAVVSYAEDPDTCSNIMISGFDVKNGSARGISVVGGSNIRYFDGRIDGTVAAPIYVACEGSFETYGVSDVVVANVDVANGNTGAPGVDHGAVLIFNDRASGFDVDTVTVSDIRIRDTDATASWQVALLKTGVGAITKINLGPMTFSGTGPATVLATSGVATSDYVNNISTDAAASKTTPVDADVLALVDSADSKKRKKLTWANLKAALRFGSIKDTGGATILGFNPVASAVNYFTMQNNTPGGSPFFGVDGTDPDISYLQGPKGAGSMVYWANSQADLNMIADGSGGNVGWYFTTKNAGRYRINGNDVVVTVAAPATAGSTGKAGQIAYDSTHFYVCIATNTWIRATFATW